MRGFRVLGIATCFKAEKVESKDQAMRLAPDGLDEHWVLPGALGYLEDHGT